MNELATLPHSGFGRSVPAQAKINKLLMYETGAYHQQWYRPFSTNPDGHVMAKFREQLAGQDHYTAPSFSGIAQDFLRPQSEVNPQRDAVGIDNGWNNRRIRFMMEVEIEAAMGVKNRMIVTGWTSHVGAKPVGVVQSSQAVPLLVDNDMRFYISTVMPVQTRTEYGPSGQRIHHHAVRPSHVLSDNNYTNIYNQNFLERMRPQDLFTQMSRTPLHRLRDANGHIPGVGETLFDSRTASTQTASLSLRTNVVPSTYLARVTENFSNARIATNDPGTGGGDLYGRAREYSRDTLIANNDLLSMLSETRQEPAGNVFQFRDLKRLDPNVQPVGVVSGMTQQVQNLHHTGQSEKWDGRNAMVMAATIISQCVPGLMSELAITVMGFRMTNEMATSGHYSAFDPNTHLGRTNYQPKLVEYNVQGFGGGDMTNELRAFEVRFWTEVMKDLTMDNQIKFKLDVNCHLMGETVVTISLDDKELTSYVTPSFADALLTPLVTPDKDHVMQVAEDFSTMLAVVLPSDHLATNSAPLFGSRV